MTEVTVREKTVSTGFLNGTEPDVIDVPIESLVAVESAGVGKATVYWVEPVDEVSDE